MRNSESYEAVWTLWSYLWFLGQSELEIAAGMFGMTEDEASDKIVEIASVLTMAIVSAELDDNPDIPMSEHAIPSRLLAGLKHAPAAQVLTAPYYWGVRALVATHKECLGALATGLVSVIIDKLSKLYMAWDSEVFAQMLVVAYPDAVDLIQEAKPYFS